MNEPVSHREHVRYSFHCEDVSDELRVRHFYGHEELSRPYEFFVLLQAADLSSDLHAFLGKHVAVQASRFDEAPVTFPGIVDRIVVDDDQAEQGGTLRIVPALALLELRRNTRIFQGQSALTIVQSVLEEGLAPKGRRVDVTALDASRYSTRDYCVQYQETDLAFVHRLLEVHAECMAIHPLELTCESARVAPTEQPLCNEMTVGQVEAGMEGYFNAEIPESIEEICALDAEERALIGDLGRLGVSEADIDGYNCAVNSTLTPVGHADPETCWELSFGTVCL